MKVKGNPYKVEFEINNLSMIQQDNVFKAVLEVLDYNARENLHIVVTDFLGGKHYVWNNTGIDPDGISCRECNFIDCEKCQLYLRRQKSKEREGI